MRKPGSEARHGLRRLACAAVVFLATAGTAFADRASIDAAIEMLRSRDSEAQLLAAARLVRFGDEAIPTLVDAFAAAVRNATGKGGVSEAREAVDLLGVLSRTVKSGSSAALFRRQHDCEALSGILSFAQSRDRSIRINAANLLSRVIDDSGVPMLVATLRPERLNADALYNLVRIQGSIADRVSSASRAALAKSLENTKRFVAEEPWRFGKTAAAVEQSLRSVANENGGGEILKPCPDRAAAMLVN